MTQQHHGARASRARGRTRRSTLVRAGVIAALAGALAPAAGAQSLHESLLQLLVSNRPHACDELAGVPLRDTTIHSATLVTGGAFTPPGATAPLTALPEFCRVVGTVYPTINFEVWLPAVQSWNGKFAASGSGSMGGYINYAGVAGVQSGMSHNLRRGYVAAATDQGHERTSTAWLLDPGRLVDWGSRANHEVALRAKALTKAYYGRAPKYSYFEGCSGGGQQAMMQAQRYPADFDGIIAGAPAHNWSALMVSELWNGQATLASEASRIPAAKLPAINSAVLAACDLDDGVQDGLVSNPPACQFDPGVLACSGADGNDCLTPAQLEGLRKLYAGPVNPRTGELIYRPLSKGGELNWGPQVAGPLPSGSTTTWFRWGVFEDANWDWKVFDYDKDWEKARAKLSYINDANDPDLRPFRDRGGKLLMWHGWGDYLIAAEGSVEYYDNLVGVIGADGALPSQAALRRTQDFARLFMIPGLGHCAGGPGTETFDAMGALERWVEQGKAPDRIEASKVVSGTAQKTRPLCPYPEIATYKGSGDPNDAASFRCAVPD